MLEQVIGVRSSPFYTLVVVFVLLYVIVVIRGDLQVASSLSLPPVVHLSQEDQ